MMMRRSFLKSGLLWLPSVALANAASPLLTRRSNSDLKTPFSDICSYYRLDETSGTRYDLKGRNNLTEVGTCASAAGQRGDCAGLLNDINYLTSSSADFTPDPIEFTFSLWHKSPAGAQNKCVIQTGWYGDHPGLYVIVAGTKEAVYVVGTTKNAVNAGGASFPTEWEHSVIRVSYTEYSSITWWLNGAKNEAPRNHGWYVATGPFYIGYAQLGGYDFEGYVDELAYWKRALSDVEVTWLYNSGAGRFL